MTKNSRRILSPERRRARHPVPYAIPPPGPRQKNKINMCGAHAQIKGDCEIEERSLRPQAAEDRTLRVGMTGFGGCPQRAKSRSLTPVRDNPTPAYRGQARDRVRDDTVAPSNT